MIKLGEVHARVMQRTSPYEPGGRFLIHASSHSTSARPAGSELPFLPRLGQESLPILSLAVPYHAHSGTWTYWTVLIGGRHLVSARKGHDP